ncbi:hypothetical protein [Methanosphaera sp.]
MKNKSLIIICITVILCAAIISATAIMITNNNQNNANTNQENSVSSNTSNSEGSTGSSSSSSSSESTSTSQTTTAFRIKSATFYSDGNPNTGEKATINVGSEHAGETIDVMTYYYRGNSRLNYPSGYTTLVVNSNGEVSLTDTTPMPKYPSKCHIDIMYRGSTYTADASIGTYKGTQTVTF